MSSFKLKVFREETPLPRVVLQPEGGFRALSSRDPAISIGDAIS